MMTQKELWIRTIDNVRSYVADSTEECDYSPAINGGASTGVT